MPKPRDGGTSYSRYHDRRLAAPVTPEAEASGFFGRDVTPNGVLAGIRTVVGGEALL